MLSVCLADARLVFVPRRRVLSGSLRATPNGDIGAAMNAIVSEFDEKTYLDCNPDVKRAVDAGQFRSGLDHFLSFGHAEKRPGVTSDPVGKVSSLPHPPEHLRLRVHGAKDIDGYLRIGQIVADDLNRLMTDDSISIAADAKVLDFGCGPGRVAIWLRQQHANWKLFATDIDAEAIHWARMHLGDIAKFECNAPMPPLHYPDNYFDFVYSISIFTHLPEDMQLAWLSELARVTRRGGQLVLTTHGEELLQFAMPNTGFHYTIGRGTDGLPAFYQTSYQTPDYVRCTWQRYFKIEKIIPRGLARHQDLVICRK